MLSIVTSVFAVCYLFLALQCRSGFVRIHATRHKTSETRLPDLTIIVAARNEAHSITACLDAFASLDYPAGQVHFIVVDDGSTDSTPAVVRAHPLFGNALVLLPSEGERSGKGEAIKLALAHASTEIVLTTDADCIVPSTWLRSMVSCLDDQTAFVAGPVLYSFDTSVAQRIQALEFLGLVAVGAGTLGLDFPTICNSANLCYRRSVFIAMSAKYPELSELPGFDEVLLQAIHRDSTWRVAFSPGKDAAVITAPANGFGTFLKQRIRWASLAGRVPDWRVRIVSAVIFLFFACVIASIASVLFFGGSFVAFSLALLIKLVADFGILSVAAKAYGRNPLLSVLLPAELLHIPYILTTSILGLFKTAEINRRQW